MYSGKHYNKSEGQRRLYPYMSGIGVFFVEHINDGQDTATSGIKSATCRES